MEHKIRTSASAPEKRGGYPAGNKTPDQLKPPPASISKPAAPPKQP